MFPSQKKQQNLAIAYIQLHYFMSPLYMAHSYEKQKGFQHQELARAIHETSFHLNYTVGSVENEVSFLRNFWFGN